MKVAIAGIGLALLLGTSPAAAQERELMLADGQQFFLDGGCLSCHSVSGSGGTEGPDLSHLGSKYDEDALAKWIRDPESHKVLGHTERFSQLTRSQVQALAAYLSSLR